MEIRRFEKEDWYPYAGAEEFRKDEPPFILELELQYNAEACIIADKNGIQVTIGSGAVEVAWMKQVELDPLRAEGELRAIAKAVENITYAPDLAYEFDHPSTEALKGFQYCGTF